MCVCVGKYWRTVKGDSIKNISEIQYVPPKLIKSIVKKNHSKDRFLTTFLPKSSNILMMTEITIIKFKFSLLPCLCEQIILIFLNILRHYGSNRTKFTIKFLSKIFISKSGWLLGQWFFNISK